MNTDIGDEGDEADPFSPSSTDTAGLGGIGRFHDSPAEGEAFKPAPGGSASTRLLSQASVLKVILETDQEPSLPTG
jgi:hypothetical protein